MLEIQSAIHRETPASSLVKICDRISTSGFLHVKPSRMREHLAEAEAFSDLDLNAFAESWERLLVDEYMADGGAYRRRRHSVFNGSRSAGAVDLAPHRPHYQTIDNNPLNGGIARHFHPLEPTTLDSPVFKACLSFANSIFGRLQPFAEWDIEVHQFRIDALPDSGGRATPEGTHQDGVDYVLMMLIARINVIDGETSITDLRGARKALFTLASPFEAALVDDTRVAHGVSPIMRLDPARSGHRDMLVVTFKRR